MTFESIFQILNMEFVILAIWAMFFISIATAFLGNFVVHKKLYFIIPTVSHSAFAGLAFAYLIGTKNYLIAIVFAILFLIFIVFLKEKLKADYESLLSVLFIFAMALGILFISLKQSYDPELNTILFGNILTISKSEVFVLSIIAFITFVLFITLFRGIEMIVFDEEFAKIENVPVGVINAIIFSLITLTIVFSLKAIGTILIFAYFVLPPLIAHQITHNFKKLIFLSFLISIIASIISIFISFYFNIPSGSSLVVTLTIIYLLFIIFSPKKKCKEKLKLRVENNS